MAGQRQKPAELLQGKGSRFRGSSSAVLPKSVPDARVAPAPPAGITAAAKARWVAFWQSDVSWAVDADADGEGLRRWITCVSERGKLERRLRQQPLTLGSMGQPVVNPVAALIAQYDRQIARAEDHFGMTALARMRLGIATTTAMKGKRELDNLGPPQPVWAEVADGELTIVAGRSA